MNGWFVTGTDTHVGKTRVAAALLRHLNADGVRAVGMKPVASGAEYRNGAPYWQDVEALCAADRFDCPVDQRNPYRFEPAIAPHIAAEQAAVQIDFQRIRQACMDLANQADRVVVEGAGGWYVPLGADGSMATLAKQLDLPVILVVGMRLGCINHALLTARAIRADGCRLAGWVANRIDPDMAVPEDNLATLCQLMPAPLLAEMAWQPDRSGELSFLPAGLEILR